MARKSFKKKLDERRACFLISRLPKAICLNKEIYMNPTKFDGLTKELAKSTSRRNALKTIVTASIGSVVGLAGIRTIFGDKIKCGGGPSNSDCAHWCAAVFGADTPAAGRCTSDAAHNRGICCECGTVAPAHIRCGRGNNCFLRRGTVC